jgi:hypothetical protein
MKTCQVTSIIFIVFTVCGNITDASPGASAGTSPASSQHSSGKKISTSQWQDIRYSFDAEEMASADDAFHFLRSFVDFFYLTFNANRSSLPALTELSSVAGWCVGDAHPENFGILLQENGQAPFTMNDFDDSGPCPIALDLYRLMVSSKLYDVTIDLSKLVSAYQLGITGNSYKPPTAVKDLVDKALDRGTTPSDKKVKNGRLVRTGEMTEVSAPEKMLITQTLNSVYIGMFGQQNIGKLILDLVATRKAGGGSGGLLRYEVLIDNGDTPLHLEFKELVLPAVYPVAPFMPKTSERIANTIALLQGSNSSRYYRVVTLNGKEMLIRPRFAGNQGVNLDKQSAGDNRELIQYEAYVLGVIHSRSLDSDKKISLATWSKMIDTVTAQDWDREVSLMTGYFGEKYKALK